MSLEPKHMLDALAHKMLRNRREQPPADLFDRVIGELDQDKDRALFYWLNGRFGWMLAGAILTSLAILLYTQADEPVLAEVSTVNPIASIVSNEVVSKRSNAEAIAFEQVKSSEAIPTAFAKTNTANRERVGDFVATENSMSRIGKGKTQAFVADQQVSLSESELEPELEVKNTPATTEQQVVEASTSIAAPKEFEGFAQLGFQEQIAALSQSELAKQENVDGFFKNSSAGSGSSFLRSTTLSGVESSSSKAYLKGLKACPSLAAGKDKNLRMNFYGGPRFDRQVFANVGSDLLDYRIQREESETTNTGLNIGARVETGASTGPFGGIGIEFGQYTSNGFTFGPVERWLALTYTENGVIDTVKLIPFRDTFAVKNRTQTMAFSLTGGYRYQLKRLALYVAADINYEVVTESSGLVVDINGEDTSYRLGDDWIRKSPGVAIGGRAGIDINVLPTPNGDPGPLGLTIEATARNSGVFSGSRDPLSYRYSRMGFNAGLRYTF